MSRQQGSETKASEWGTAGRRIDIESNHGMARAPGQKHRFEHKSLVLLLTWLLHVKIGTVQKSLAWPLAGRVTLLGMGTRAAAPARQRNKGERGRCSRQQGLIFRVTLRMATKQRRAGKVQQATGIDF